MAKTQTGVGYVSDCFAGPFTAFQMVFLGLAVCYVTKVLAGLFSFKLCKVWVAKQFGFFVLVMASDYGEVIRIDA